MPRAPRRLAEIMATESPSYSLAETEQPATLELSRVPDAPQLLRASWHEHGTAVLGAELRRLDGGELPQDMPLGRYHGLSPSGFLDDPASCAREFANHTADNEQLWIVFFHILPDCVDDFKALLLAECEATLVAEPRMLRYDLLQYELDPSRFVVLEFVPDADAQAAHEARRADGTMRAALAVMEATSRKKIPGSALRWGAADRRALQGRLAWPSDWRSSAARRILRRPEDYFAEALAIAGAEESTLLLRAALQSTIQYSKGGHQPDPHSQGAQRDRG